MDDLIARLLTDQAVTAQTTLCSDATGLKEMVDRGLVHVTFTSTRGGTRLQIV